MRLQDDAMVFIMFLETTKSGIADPIKVKKHFSPNEDGLKLKIASGTTSFLASNVLFGVNAWIFASTTKSSSAFINSMQLCKLYKTVSSSNCLEQGPPLAPQEHLQPLCKNFIAFSINWFSPFFKI